VIVAKSMLVYFHNKGVNMTGEVPFNPEQHEDESKHVDETLKYSDSILRFLRENNKSSGYTETGIQLSGGMNGDEIIQSSETKIEFVTVTKQNDEIVEMQSLLIGPDGEIYLTLTGDALKDFLEKY
jgi:hypothetical protein